MALCLELHSGIGDIFAVDVGEGLTRLDTGVLQAFQHINHIRRMHTARTCTAAEEVVTILAEQRHTLDILPRQCSVVLQQHDTLVGTLARDGSMSREIRLVGGGILAETRCLNDIFQHTAYIAVYISDGEFAVLHTVDDLLHLGRLSGFHEIVAGLYLTDGGESLTDTNPVCHHDTLIAPVITEDTGQQVAVTH